VGDKVIEITNKPIVTQTIIDRVRKSSHGAVVTFVGTVRDQSEGKRILYLEYEAYTEMAKKKLEEICIEIQNHWGSSDVDIVHRVGRIEVGDIVVVIVVGSSHRLEAFQSCQYAIDCIKEKVPIWKKEFYEGGTSTWIGHA
jgi:molybdopterin synthase catalytic subunit